MCGACLIQQRGSASMKFELFQDTASEWRWRLIASNNVDVVATSGEGYKAKADADKAVAQVKAGAAKAEVVDVKE